MSEFERIFLIALAPFIIWGSLRFAWIEWHDPLRDRSQFQRQLMGMSELGLGRKQVVGTRVRTSPAAAIAFLFVMIGAELTAFDVHSNAAVWAVYGVAAVAVAVWMLVALFNRPRWAVPPAVRAQPGMVEYQRRHVPEPDFTDPRVPEASRRSRH
jgi:hypothetical protein